MDATETLPGLPGGPSVEKAAPAGIKAAKIPERGSKAWDRKMSWLLTEQGKEELALRHLYDAYPAEVRRRTENAVTIAKMIGFEIESFQKVIISEYYSGTKEIVIFIPRGNGKTTLFAILALIHLMQVKNAGIYVGAASTKQAKILFQEASRMVREDPAISKRIKVKWDEIVSDKHGFLRTLASDADTAQGLIPTLLLADERHAWKPNSLLYEAMKFSMTKKHEIVQLISITTAGHDKTGALHQQLREAKRSKDKAEYGHLTVCRNRTASFCLFEWACKPEREDPTDPFVVKLANPASFVRIEELIQTFSTPGVNLVEVMRYHANVWSNVRNSWLRQHDSWKKLADPTLKMPTGVECFGGVDIGLKKDSTAVAWVWQHDEDRIGLYVKFWHPLGDGTAIRLKEVEEHIAEMNQKNEVLGVAYDKFNFVGNAQNLSEDEGILMIETPMSLQRKIEMSNNLYLLVEEEKIVHDGDETLAEHFENAEAVHTRRGWFLDKDPKGSKIDGLIASMLAASIAEDMAIGGGWDQSEGLMIV